MNKELKLLSIVRRKKPKYIKGDLHKVYPNLLNKCFIAHSPNTIWCTDFTYMYLQNGKTRYNCSILDLYDRSIVATLNGKEITSELAINTLQLALNKVGKRTNKIIIHSDQGRQYTSKDFTEFCIKNNLQQSMSKAGCPYDNAPMERYFNTFKNEFLYLFSFKTDEILNNSVYNFALWYNHVRPHSFNAGLTPFGMTKKLTKVAMTTALAAAAIVPAVVATPAQAAEAEVTFAKAYYSTANGTAAFEAGKLAGVISATTDTGITHLEASNGEVFTMQAFSAYLAVNPTATTDQVLTALSKAGKALSADQVKALNVKEGKVEGGKVTVDADAPVTEVKVESVKAINANALELQLNKKVENLDGLTFSAKRGSTNVILTPTLSASKDSIILTSATKLAAGDYTVTVTGGDFAEGSNSVTTKVEAEKETTLTIQNESVQKVADAKINFEVKNQYGEVMNVVSSNVVATAYDKTAGEAPNTTGAVILTPVAGKTQFQGNFTPNTIVKGDEVLLTFSYKGLTTTKTITVQAASALSTLELQAPQPLTGKTRITTGESIELPYVAKDQYGSDSKLPTTTADQDTHAGQEKIGDWLFTSSNPSVVSVDAMTVDADGKVLFTAGTKGTAKITAVNVTSGDITSVDVEVSAAATESTISLTAPNEIVVAGEKVKVPFTAYDQFGDAIKASDLTPGNITLASSDASATVAWVGKEIVITGVSAGTTEISATIDGKVTKFSVDVLAAATPTKVTGVKDVASVLTNGASATIKPANLVIKDQYNRDYTLKGTEGVIVYLKDGTETSLNVKHTAGEVTAASNIAAGLITADGSTSVVTIEGLPTAGTETLVFELVGNTGTIPGTIVAGSKFESVVTTKAATDVTSYTLDTVPTLYGKSTHTNTALAGTYAKDLKVTAKDANGSVVAIPASDILSVTSSDTAIAVVDKATMKVAGKAEGTATVTILVKKGDGTTETLTQTVTVSEVAPLAQTVKFKDADGKVDIAAGTVGTIATAVAGDTQLVITDQYTGKALKADDIIVTTLVDAGNDNMYSYDASNGQLTVSNAANGDKFILTAVSNGKTDTLEVTVTP